MTKFVNYYNLCSISDPREFLGISEGRDNEGTLITTLSRNIVIVIKINTQKQLHSWSVVEKLSSRVVYDRQSEKYVGIFSRFLRCWDESTTDVNKCKKLKFQKSLAELVTYEGHTYVLYADGNCERLDKALESRKNESNASHQLDIEIGHTFSHAKIIQMPDTRLMLTYFDHNNNNGQLDLVCRYIEDGSTRRFKIKRESLNVTVAGYAIIEGNQFPMLLTIWSDKRLFLLTLNDTVQTESSPGNYVSMITALKVDSPLSILGISRNFVAIYGANSGQEGATLLLYNTQFKVIKAKQFFKVYFDFSRLWNINDHILLAMGQNLSVISYHMTKELLADLVGTQLNNDFLAPTEVDHINEEEPLQECMQFVSSQIRSRATADDSDQNVIAYENCEADGKRIPFESTNDFDDMLYELCKLQQDIDVVEVEQPSIDDANIIVMGNYEDNWTSTHEVQIIIQQLERCGASEHEITEKLLPVLIKADLITDIITCLRRYTNISEKMLVKTLCYILNKIQSKRPALDESQMANGIKENDVADNDEIIALQTLIGCTFDTSTLAIHMRNDIDYAKVALLFELLYEQLINMNSIYVQSSFSLPPSVQLELQILRWFQVCLNAHFQKLALSKDVKLIELLYKWHQQIATYKNEMVELEQTLAVLYNLVERRKIFKEKSYSKWYSIEEVTLF